MNGSAVPGSLIAVLWNMKYRHAYVHVQVSIVREMKKEEERSKQGQTNNKAKQHNIPKATCTLYMCYNI